MTDKKTARRWDDRRARAENTSGTHFFTRFNSNTDKREEPPIPPSLAAYAEEVRKGLAAIRQRRESDLQVRKRTPTRPTILFPISLPAPPAALDTRPQNSSVFPEHVKVWPVLGISARGADSGGAWRVWTLARALDPAGSGSVGLDTLRNYLDKLNIPARTQRRWIRAALDLGVMSEHTYQKSGQAIYNLVSLARCTEALGLSQAGHRYAILPAKRLVERGWRAQVWAAFLTTLSGRPISRAKLNKLTGVPKRTQIHWEHEVGLLVQANYGVNENMPADKFLSWPDIQEIAEKAAYAFNFRDRSTGREVVAWQVPNTYRVPLYLAKRGRRGRARKANKSLKLRLVNRGAGPDDKRMRLYHETHTSARAVLKTLDRWRPGPEIYVRRRTSVKARCGSWSLVS